MHSGKRRLKDGDDGNEDDEEEPDSDDKEDDRSDANDNEEPAHDGSDEDMLNDRAQSEKTAQSTSEQPRGSVQILDLHSKNPLISYMGQVYSCAWGRTVGTDIVLAKSGTLDETFEPVHQGEGFDVVSVSRTKLVGKPVTLEPKGAAAKRAGPGPGSFSSTLHSSAPEQGAVTASDGQATEPVDATTETAATAATTGADEPEDYHPPARAAQWDPASDLRAQERNRWLQRFAEIRAKRGEGLIPVKSGRQIINYIPRLPGNVNKDSTAASNPAEDTNTAETEGENGDQTLTTIPRPPPLAADASASETPHTIDVQGPFETPWERVKAGRRGEAPATPRGAGGRPRSRARGRGGRGRGSRSRPASSLNTIDALIGVREDGTSSSWTGPSPYAPMDQGNEGDSDGD